MPKKFRDLNGKLWKSHQCMSNFDAKCSHGEFVEIEDLTKETIYDRVESKLIDRVCEFRKLHPNLKVGEIQRPLIIGGIADGVFEVDVEY